MLENMSELKLSFRIEQISEVRAVFRTQMNIYDEMLLLKVFQRKNIIVDVPLGCKYTSRGILEKVATLKSFKICTENLLQLNATLVKAKKLSFLGHTKYFS